MFGLRIAMAGFFALGVSMAANAEDLEDSVEVGKVISRISGDAELKIEQSDDKTIYVAGESKVDTPLPVGYPPPTPPGVIEIKQYPKVRRATVGGKGKSALDPMRGTTGAFWPLFAHIKSRGIAMTAPVELDYSDLDDADGEIEWSMSFLYRRLDQGPTNDGVIVDVVDAEPVTVISIGHRGDMDGEALQAGLQELREAIEKSEKWQVAGDPRTMGYNGPNIPRKNRWWEIQLPVQAN
ncbi:heme-binding protein [Stratiformator vulcanicus]|uniref:SOUL heme-binding protein n=1 Tax=Stratiformator vulcanicus TaxID=2527980 RepID=A0A517QW01_9PLAN|nr:heme-binding protein [Stratiformator vulcanicus]QDT35821.1 SOUL heme-binding protein [Stratiformator vulcanicus]